MYSPSCWRWARTRWNIDMSRAARETFPTMRPLGYYRIWLAALEQLMRNAASCWKRNRRPLHPPVPVRRAARGTGRRRACPGIADRAPTARPRASASRRVRTRHAVPHHTRLPGYVRGVGVVERAWPPYLR
jgi:nitrile hydratase